MRYDFITLPNRIGKGSAKWNQMFAMKPDIRKDAVPLSVADMEFVNPPEIIEGLREYLKTAVLGYTEPTEAYYDAVISWMSRRKHWTVKREEITCTPGVIPALYTAVRAFSEPGDGVLIMTPAYPPFYQAVKVNGRRVVESALHCTENGYEMDLEDIDSKTRPSDVKILFLCNPHNPTGRSWRREELEKLGEICVKNDLIVVSDEIHSDLIMPGIRHTVFAALSEALNHRTVTCTAPSKTFNLAGMQTSNIVIADEGLRRLFRTDIDRATAGHFLNIAGYEACRIAYTECEEWLEELLAVIWDNYQFMKSFVAERMPEVRVFPLEGTYLAWLDFSAYGFSVEEIESRNVQKAEVVLDEGYIFGAGGACHERVNLACPRWVLEQSMERLAAAYA